MPWSRVSWGGGGLAGMWGTRRAIRAAAPSLQRSFRRGRHARPADPCLPPFRVVQGILAQNLVLMVLVYSLQRHPWPRRGLCFLLLAGWAGAVLSGAVTRHAISAVFDLNNMLFIASRVPQILQNFSTGSTGTLSPITYGLNAAGGAARIFTSLHEKAGAAMVRGAMLGAALNAVVLAQIAAYRGRRGAERVKTE